MNPVVKAQLMEFRQNNASEGLEDEDLFEVYCCNNACLGILNESVDPFEVHLSGDEFGLDGVAILVDGQLCRDPDEVITAFEKSKSAHVEFVFIQAKTSEKNDYGEVSKFLDAVVGFFNGDMQGESDTVDELMNAKDAVFSSALRENPIVSCFYCSTGKEGLSGHLEKLVAANRERLEELNLFSEIDLSFLGAKSLQEAYRSATNSISEQIDLPKCITLPDHEAVEQAFIGYMAADQLLKLATRKNLEGAPPRINPSVFFDNIRDFNSRSPINQGIISELSEGSAPSFVFKNNGITVVAKEVSRTGDRFRLDDYQIVNGCQTTNILFHSRNFIEGVFVPVRIIGTEDPEFIASIIVGTNNQNEVKEEQFWALKPFLKDLEEYCRNQTGDRAIFLERREHQFREESVERTRIIKPRDLMKAIGGMFLFRPHRSARDYRGIRKEFEDIIFREDHRVEPYHAAALASYRFDFITRNQRVQRSWRIYKYYILFEIGARATEGKSVFNMPQKQQAKVCGEVIDSLLDEPNFVKTAEEVSGLLDEMIGSRRLETREQIRDALRSEAFVKEFAKSRGFSNVKF